MRKPADLKMLRYVKIQIFTRVPQESPSQKMQAVFGRQKGGGGGGGGGHGPRRSMREPRKLGTRARAL